MIYGYTQSFHCTPDYVLHGISYKNLMLYGSAAPSYDTDKKDADWDDSIDANIVGNFDADIIDEEDL
jgi:hypothetical protein